MGLFGFGKKKEEVKGECCCSSAPVEESANECCCGSAPIEEPECGCNGSVSEDKTYIAEDGCCACGGNGCHIKVLGAGCKSCHEQHENVKKAVANMSLDAEVEYITDMEKVMSYGVMSMPAIVVNEQIVSMGKVLKAAQVEELLKKLGC
ncbi:thioredoxin family protein [Ruminococcus sp. 5_1_39BFAA]|uniref:thioredoxin family protein n=1 Tax=Ruminococcus sp. 5_1_39BFAA TaxID=457412 RepID=UPI00356B37D2